jgi:methyl acetate hydrolase
MYDKGVYSVREQLSSEIQRLPTIVYSRGRQPQRQEGSMPLTRTRQMTLRLCILKNSALITVALVCTGLFSLGVCAQTVDQLSAPSKAALDRVLSNAVEQHLTPGVVGLIVDRKGVLFEGAAGFLDSERKTTLPVNAIYKIASMTKPVTSVAIMLLREQGKLDLDDPVSKYLPGFDHLQVITKFDLAKGTYEVRPAVKQMTLLHLLTHTSGIGYGFASPLLAKLQSGSTKNEWEFPLLHEPGEKWTYGASTKVLGLIVEKISGETLENYFQQNILVPLGMTDTSYAVPIEKQSRVPVLYNHIDGKFKKGSKPAIPSMPTPPFPGDGGLYSTASDYGRFVRMLLNGGRFEGRRILGEESVRLMATNNIGDVVVSEQAVGIPAFSKPFPLGAGRDKFGLGFQIAVDGPAHTAGRAAGSLSWAGLFNTEFWIDGKSGIGAVLLMQYLPFYDPAALRTLQDFETTVYREFKTP